MDSVCGWIDGFLGFLSFVKLMINLNDGRFLLIHWGHLCIWF